MANAMRRVKHPSNQPGASAGAATPDRSAAVPSTNHRAALDDYLQALRATGARLLRHSTGKVDPKLAAALRNTIMEQYHSVKSDLFSRRLS